jgi:hypothetical protein
MIAGDVVHLSAIRASFEHELASSAGRCSRIGIWKPVYRTLVYIWQAVLTLYSPFKYIVCIRSTEMASRYCFDLISAVEVRACDLSEIQRTAPSFILTNPAHL